MILSVLILVLLYTPLITTLAYYLVILRRASKAGAPPSAEACRDTLSLEVVVPVRGEPVSVVSRAVSRNLAALERSCASRITVLSDDDPEHAERLSRALGGAARVVRREEPRGGRTGALDDFFFRHAESDYVLVLDADAQLGDGALERACCSADGLTTLVIPWRGYYDEETRVAKVMKFMTDMGSELLYTMRSRAGFFVFPLGSGTAYPVRVVRELGGWGPGVIQDDIHMGVKLALAGYETRLLEGVHVEVLVPSKLRSLRRQQGRWAYGTSEVLSRSLLAILRCRRLPLAKRLEMIAYMAQPLQTTPVFLSTALAPAAALLEPGFGGAAALAVIAALALPTLALAAACIGLYLRLSSTRADPGEALANIGSFAAILTVLSPVLSLNALRGLARRPRPYEVTPKGEKEKALSRDPLPAYEAAYGLAAAALSALTGNAAALLVSLNLLVAATYALARLE
ncbi:MAG: glycosyltransferase family 2 protein [Thermofilum sp.]|nr:glycosyltransferase family 2 protein [Thermofilum sp.]